MPAWWKIPESAPDTTPLLADPGSPTPSSSKDNGSYRPDSHSRNYADNDRPLWSEPLGAPARRPTDEHLLMFRRAVGININQTLAADTENGTLEQGNSRNDAVGLYRTVIHQERRRRILHHSVSGLVWACHGTQIVVGATLTCLGLKANEFPVCITVLGAVNTVVAGVLALIKGKNLPEKLGQTEADFRQLKAWIEETESLLALGVIGSDRKEVGMLVQTAYRQYNACFGRSFEIEADIDRGVDALSIGEGEDAVAGQDYIE